MSTQYADFMKRMPIVAILRGITPSETIDVMECILDSGICIAEVPLNSPEALDTIRLISEKYADRILVGAGTVLSSDQVKMVADAGGKLIVSPNTDTSVIETTRKLDLISLPGVATPSEAFKALDAGASGLKAFPAEMISPQVIKSWLAVLPQGVDILPVGGITPDSMESYWAAGARGFGIGGGLYTPGKSITDVHASAQAFSSAAKRNFK